MNTKCVTKWWGKQDDEIRQRIGISLQETRLSDKLNVRETVTLFRSFYRSGIAPDEAIAAVPDEWVDMKSLVGPPARIRER